MRKAQARAQAKARISNWSGATLHSWLEAA
jgi:hypothetical protein